MKERLFAILQVMALLFAAAPPDLLAVPLGVAGPLIISYADCQGGDQCSN